MPSRRHQRVRQLLIRTIGEVLRRELPLSEVGLVTVNDVGLAGDMQSARVFVSFLGAPEQHHKGLALLHRNRKRLQTLVGHAVVLKYTPRLEFVLDDSVERGNRVMWIIEELEKTLPEE